jgi:hypothetical protein
MEDDVVVQSTGNRHLLSSGLLDSLFMPMMGAREHGALYCVPLILLIPVHFRYITGWMEVTPQRSFLSSVVRHSHSPAILD